MPSSLAASCSQSPKALVSDIKFHAQGGKFTPYVARLAIVVSFLQTRCPPSMAPLPLVVEWHQVIANRDTKVSGGPMRYPYRDLHAMLVQLAIVFTWSNLASLCHLQFALLSCFLLNCGLLPVSPNDLSPVEYSETYLLVVCCLFL